MPWLLALHDQDISAYTTLIYGTIVELEDNSFKYNILSTQPHSNEKVLSEYGTSCDETDASYFRLILPALTTEYYVLFTD
jgi:hypothetical protein